VPELSKEEAILRLLNALDELVTQVEISGAVDDHGQDLRNLAALREARDLIHDPEIRRLAGLS